jgi:hypothetical protein
MGIEQLVDTYKGNPQPLQAKVQKDQQSQPPGGLTPDMEEAIALQKIIELRQGAQNQQSIQAGGAQLSVVEKLRQMLAGNQAQAQMAQGAPAQQGEPVMAARGGSIDQLMSNLGQYYAGGGIVAFKEGDEVEDPDAGNRPLLERLLYANISPAEKERRRRLALQAAAGQTVPAQQESPNANMGSLIEKLLYSNTTPVEQQRRAALQTAAEERSVTPVDGFPQQTGPKENMGSLIEKLLYSNLTPAEQRRRAALQAAANERAGISPPVPPTTLSNRAALNAADAGLRSQSGASNRALLNAADADLRSQPAESAPAVVKPAGVGGAGGAGLPAAPAVAAVEKLDPNSLRGLTEAYIKGEFGLSPEAERDKAVEFAKRTMGLDALLGEKERRANEREASIKQAQGERMPAWVEALAAAGKPVRGGLGTLLGQMGGQAQATREAYQTQDLKYQAELAQLRDVITDAKIAGNKDLVKEGMAAYKEVDARRRAAATNATSLVNTDENVAMRKQVAKDEAARRAQSSSQHNANMALALEERKRQFNESELRKMREKDVDRANKIETAIAKRTAMIDMSLQNPKLKPEEEAALQARRNAIVKQVQAEYPPVKPEKPSESQFLAAARAEPDNKAYSDAQLKAFYKQKYGS